MMIVGEGEVTTPELTIFHYSMDSIFQVRKYKPKKVAYQQALIVLWKPSNLLVGSIH